jgi:hypothetical protein
MKRSACFLSRDLLNVNGIRNVPIFLLWHVSEDRSACSWLGKPFCSNDTRRRRTRRHTHEREGGNVTARRQLFKLAATHEEETTNAPPHLPVIDCNPHIRISGSCRTTASSTGAQRRRFVPECHPKESASWTRCHHRPEKRPRNIGPRWTEYPPGTKG